MKFSVLAALLVVVQGQEQEHTATDAVVTDLLSDIDLRYLPLANTTWDDVPNSGIGLSKLIAVAVRDGFDPSVLDESTPSSMLGLYPAVKISGAVASGDLVVDETVLKDAAQKVRLSRGQASVLANAYFDEMRETTNAALDLPRDYIFATPSEFITTGWGETFRMKPDFLARNGIYRRLLPSQRVAVLWISFSKATSGSLTSFVSGLTSSTRLGSDGGCKLDVDKLVFDGPYLPAISLSMRNCLTDGSLDASAVPFPLLMSLKALDVVEWTDLESLGSTAFTLKPEDVVGKVDPADLKRFVSTRSELHKCVCLDVQRRRSWTEALLEAFGEPEQWTTSDLLDLGNLLPSMLVNSTTMGRIEEEAMRAAAPSLVSTSCLGKFYAFFPGFEGRQVSFEQACVATLPTEEDAKAFSESADQFASALYNVTLVNVALALTRKDEETIVENATDIEAAKQHFVRATFELANGHVKSDRTTQNQRAKFSRLVQDQASLFQEVVSKVFGVPKEEIPNSKSGINEFLKDKSDDITGLQLDELRRRVNDISFSYTKDLVRVFDFGPDLYAGPSKGAFCHFAGCSEEEVVNSLTTATATLPSYLVRKARCYAAVASGFAAASLTPESLAAWDDRQLLHCVDTFGELQNVKAGLWEHLLSRLGDDILHDGLLMPEYMSLLGNLLGDVAAANRSLINMDGTIDALSRLGSLILDQDTTAEIAKEYLSTNGDDVSQLDLVSLGNLFCGLPVDEVEKILASKPDLPVELFGVTINWCGEVEILKLLAKNLTKPIGNWTEADVATYGVLFAGLEPEDVSQIPDVSLRGLSPAAVTHLMADHLSAFTPAQLSNIPEESMSVLRPSQLSHLLDLRLDDEQLEALLDKHEDWLAPDVLPDYVERLEQVGVIIGDRLAKYSEQDRGGSCWILPSPSMMLIVAAVHIYR